MPTIKNDDIYFCSQQFADYGHLAPTIAVELNNVLKETIAEENITLCKGTPLPNKIEIMKGDMKNNPDLYVSTSLAWEMGQYLSKIQKH